MTFVPVLYTNKGASTLTAGIAAGSPGDVVILHIQTGDASRFNPSGTPGTTDVAIGNEYLTITAGWGTTSLTATRGQYGTPAEQHFVNDPVTETLTASELAALFQTAHPLGGVLTGTLPNPGLAAGAVTLDRLAQSGATTGQVPQWNGSAWVPGSSSGSYTLPDATTGAIGGVRIDTAPVSGDPVALTQAGTALPAGMLGATGTTAAAGNDARLSDQRTPLDGSVTTAKLAYLSSIPVAQSTVPANPPVGDQALFIDTADGKLKRVDHTGAVTTIEDGSGTVTSVGLSVPAWLSVTGTPVTTSGTLAVTVNTQAANQILAGPATGASATPVFRALVAADLPIATTGALGAVKPDGTTITVAAGVISSVGGGGGSSTLAADTDVSISSPAVGDALIYNGSAWANKKPWVKQLDYAAAADLFSGSGLTASTWTDLIANQSFTVDDANSLVEIVVRGFMFVGGVNSGTSVSSRINVDSAGTPVLTKIGGMENTVAAQYVNPLNGGSMYLTGLSAASHTVKVQVFANAAENMFLRASTNPDTEFLTIQVIEWK